MTMPGKIWAHDGWDEYDVQPHHDFKHPYIRADIADDLARALESCLEWIDAVPNDTQLPTMPGFDRDELDQKLAAFRANTH